METKKKNKVVEFVKNHKKQIAIAAGIVAAGGLMITKTRAKEGFDFITYKDIADIKDKNPDFGDVLDAWVETMPSDADWVNALIQNMPAANLKRAVEAVIRNHKDVTPDTVVNAVVGFKVG